MTILWLLPLVPVVAGLLLWVAGPTRRPDGPPSVDPRIRMLAGATALLATAVALALAVWAALTRPTATADVGAGLTLVLDVDPIGAVAAVLVPAVALPILAYAAAHEPAPGLRRLLGLGTTFVGAMLLLVLAADLATLTVGWELVGALSWGLIAHEWRERDTAPNAAHAFNTTRAGGLGLFVAAGAAFAATGSLAFDALPGADGAMLHVVVAGVLVASLAKSGQLPFSPWLFSAMSGPTPVSALLHSATMVAAGAITLARLHPVLERVPWAGPVLVAVGLATALAGGLVAAVQSHAKKLLAASTSAHYGLMLVAVGVGHPAIAMTHLVVHAVFKAQLFLSAGIAMAAVGSSELGRMRLGRHLRVAAVLAATGSLALAAVPPLGGAWSKEQVLAAAGHRAPWLAVLVAVAGGLSALYATRFQLLAFGPPVGEDPGPRQLAHAPSRTELAAVAALATATVVAGLLWLPAVGHAVVRLLGGDTPSGAAWELVLSFGVVAVVVYATWSVDRAGRLGHVGTTGRSAALAGWLGLPRASRWLVVDPTLRLARAAAGFDDRVVDAGVRLAGRVAERAGRLLAELTDPRVDRVVGGIAAATRALAGAGARFGEAAVDGVVGGVAAATRVLAGAGARFGEAAVDATVAGTGWLVGRGGRDAPRIQTGLIHHQYIVVSLGVVVLVVAAVLGRSS